jgi:hypothetical protein
MAAAHSRHHSYVEDIAWEKLCCTMSNERFYALQRRHGRNIRERDVDDCIRAHGQWGEHRSVLLSNGTAAVGNAATIARHTAILLDRLQLWDVNTASKQYCLLCLNADARFLHGNNLAVTMSFRDVVLPHHPCHQIPIAVARWGKTETPEEYLELDQFMHLGDCIADLEANVLSLCSTFCLHVLSLFACGCVNVRDSPSPVVDRNAGPRLSATGRAFVRSLGTQ